jgi:hypothetical protein
MTETPDKEHPRRAATGGVQAPELPGLGKGGAEVEPGRQTKHRRRLTSKQKWLVVGAIAGSLAAGGAVIAGVGYEEGWFGGSADQNPGSTTSATETETETQATFESLINPDISYEDLVNTPTIEMGYGGDTNASKTLRSQLAMLPKWVGDYNTAVDQNQVAGNRFDDVLFELGQEISGKADELVAHGFAWFGGNWGIIDTNPQTNRPETTSIGGVAMELLDKPFVRVSNSEDIITIGKNPKTGEKYYVRIAMEGEAQTVAYCVDVVEWQQNDKDLLVYSAKSEMADNYLNTLTHEELIKVIKPRTVMCIAMFGANGNNVDPEQWLTDENNIPIARVLLFWGDTVRAKEINGIMNHMEAPAVTQTSTTHPAVGGGLGSAFKNEARAAA